MADNLNPEDMSADDYLAHYGVLGMKWGRRKPEEVGQLKAGPNRGLGPNTRSANRRAGSDVGTLKPAKKPRITSDDIIRARQRTDARMAKIVAADQEVALARTAAGKKRALAVVERIAKEDFESGDQEIGRKRTRGEKVALGLVGGAVGLTVGSMLFK